MSVASTMAKFLYQNVCKTRKCLWSNVNNKSITFGELTMQLLIMTGSRLSLQTVVNSAQEVSAE